jgi:thiol-disulfide isomerase/thioredoxin
MIKNILIALVFLISTTAKAQTLFVGDAAPAITLNTPAGEPLSLSSLKGQVVLIDFWASWCGPCKAALPRISKLYKKYNAQGFTVLGVSLDDKPTAWKNAIKRFKITYPQVYQPGGWEGAVAQAYNIEYLPTTYLIDKAGLIQAIDVEGAELDAKIAELLAK